MEFRVCSDETPPCSFETARHLLWRNTNNELLPVYDRQLWGCYLKPQILRCECLGDNKWFFGKVQLCFSLKFEWWTQIWVTNSDLSEIKYHSNLSEIVWYPQIWVNPQIWAITQNWGNHAQITQNWVLHLFLRVVIYLVNESADQQGKIINDEWVIGQWIWLSELMSKLNLEGQQLWCVWNFICIYLFLI